MYDSMDNNKEEKVMPVQIHGKKYYTVAERLIELDKRHKGNYSLESEMTYFSDGIVIFRSTLKIGDNVYNRCYLTSMSMDIAPFTPVTLNASFTSLDPAINQQISGDYSFHSRSISGDRLFYGHTCEVVNMGNAVGDVQSNISFKRTLNSTPVYTLGSGQATSMLLDGVEEEMQISSTGLKTLINHSGEILNTATQVNIVNSYGTTIDDLEVLEMSAGARVLTEGYNIDGGDTVGATATIKQITL